MQKDPEKVLHNFNEFQGTSHAWTSVGGVIGLQPEVVDVQERQRIIDTGIGLVNAKVDEILGAGNKLTDGNVTPPTTRFVEADPRYPNWAGYFSPSRNEIVVMAGKVKDSLSRTKVFVHEYIHFLSHNGRDDVEQITESSPISRKNNVGFHRDSGLDIREGKEGARTSDYFLAFNEAVTEQLAIDILPSAYETYNDYRGLLAQVIKDVVAQGLGSPDKSGIFKAWSEEQVKQYIYKSFFKGDLDGFTKLLQTTYREYDLSERQFGLMTHRDDLPSVIESNWRAGNPNSPPPSPTQVAARVQKRLNSKTPDDYLSDISRSEPGSGNPDAYGLEYDTYVIENHIEVSHREVIGGAEYDIDNLGYVVYKGRDASLVLGKVRADLDVLLKMAARGEVDVAQVAEHIDHLLFSTYAVSMLSDGFREFYIDKHSAIDRL